MNTLRVKLSDFFCAVSCLGLWTAERGGGGGGEEFAVFLSFTCATLMICTCDGVIMGSRILCDRTIGRGTIITAQVCAGARFQYLNLFGCVLET